MRPPEGRPPPADWRSGAAVGVEQLGRPAQLQPTVQGGGAQAQDGGDWLHYYQEDTVPPRLPERGPWLASIMDMGDATGPRGFHPAVLDHALRTAQHVVIWSGGSEDAAYAVANRASETVVALIIECDPPFEKEWLACVRRRRPDVQVVICNRGGRRRAW